MDINVKYYNAAMHMLDAASFLRDINNEEEHLANFLTEKAADISEKIIIMDEDEAKEIKRYEQIISGST